MIPNSQKDNLFFDDIFSKYYPRLCDYAYVILGDEQFAKDLVQDAFIVFLEQQHKISTHPSAIKSYLYSIVKFSCLNTFRKSNVVNRFIQYIQKQEVDENSFEDKIIYSEVLGKIHAALAQLPEGCATVIKMGYLEGLKNDEIAQKLNISVHTVKSQKQRGIRLLRDVLDPDFFRFFVFFFMN